METLQKGITLEEWKMEVECSKAQSGCGARLSVKADNIVVTELWCMGDYLWDEYAVYCPHCNHLIKIDEGLIPEFVKKAAQERKKVKRRNPRKIFSLLFKKRKV